MKLVPVLDNFVQVVVVDFSLSEGEIAAKSQRHVVALLGVQKSFDHLCEVVHLLLGVELLALLVKDNLLVVVLVKGKPLGPTVVALLLSQQDCEDLFGISLVQLVRFP